jgi:antitoxin component YwqK of YwqJK toxin-antitoxin module
MKFCQLIAFFAFLCSFAGCTVERAEEQILARHANGVKKTSIWVYPDGTILKRNEWYNDGIKELEIPYDDSLPHGEFKRWTGFGDVAMIGHYKKGKKDGKWTIYYQNKKVEAVQYYKDDHPVGDWEGWHFNGKKAFEHHYDDNGNHVGVWKFFHDNGVLAEENRCHESKGYVKRFGRNCKITEYFDCTDGYIEGNYKKYYESYGAIDSTQNCEQAQIMEEGISFREFAPLPLTFYRADGSLIKKLKSSYSKRREKIQWFDEQNNVVRESNFIAEDSVNKPHEVTGMAYGTCANASTLFCAETLFVRSDRPNGILDSSTLSHKDDFKLSLGKFPATLRYTQKGHVLLYEEFWTYGDSSVYNAPYIQTSRSFYPDSMGGKMASEGFWQLDPKDNQPKRNGIWRNWYKSGILKDSLTYVNGERVGEQFSYDSTGKLTIHKTENGKNRPVIMHLLGK